MLAATATVRCDPEYFKQQCLADDDVVRQSSNLFESPQELGLRIDASAFYPSIEAFYDTGNFPFYRVGDVDGMVDVDRAMRIPKELCDQFPTLKTVKPGDILLTKGGAIDRTGYVTTEGAVSRDLIFLNTSCLSQPRRLLLSAYFRTAFFRRMLLRSSSQTTQPHLTITLVRKLPLFVGSAQFSEAVESTTNAAFHRTNLATQQVREAEAILLAALGLTDWRASEPLSYTARAADVSSAKRIDAQFFSLKYRELIDRLSANAARVTTIRDIRSYNARGLQPEYVADGNVYVVNSRHILEARIDYENLERTTTEWLNSHGRAKLESGDILTYTTGAKIGRTAHFALSGPAIASNHVNILRLSEGDPVYVAFVMNSLVGRLQTEQHLSGTAQPELYPTDIDKFIVPFIPEEIQTSIAGKLLQSEKLRKEAHHLFESAKRAVEVAIEQNEAAALTFLDQSKGAT